MRAEKDMDEMTVPAPEIFPVQEIEVDIIDPSPANKRRINDGDLSIKELADSIESQGLLQAIVIRRNPKKASRYEIVAGERRWRAFLLKGWKSIPVVIRDLTDQEAHDITAAENLQREDLSPIEEAESIKVLIDDGRDAKEIADRIGKPVSWVVRRSRIADLSPKWLKAIADPTHPLSKWSATHLELIARYDHEKQEKLFEEYGDHWDTQNALMTVRDLEKQLNRDMLNLSSAPWKITDETLLPAIGACTQCQKRTSCAPSLFEPIEDTKTKGDRCLDRDCWGKKLVAYHEINIKKAKEENKNLIIIDKADSRSALPDNHPWEKSVEHYSYRYDKAKKDTKGAIPAYVIDGPGAGKIEYLKTRSYYAQDERARPVGEDGKPAPKSLKERREGLEKRRCIRLITKIMMILCGEDPDLTGKKAKSGKAGICRVCGCTETTPCEDIEGNTCSWVEPDLCSACAEEERKPKKGKKKELAPVDKRIEIAEKLSNIETFALIATFGAAANEFDDDLCGYDWELFDKVVKLNGADAQRAALYGAFDRIHDHLRQMTYAPDPDAEFVNKLISVLRLDNNALLAAVVEEIPEPKAWANLKADGTQKTTDAKGKAKVEKKDDTCDQCKAAHPHCKKCCDKCKEKCNTEQRCKLNRDY